MKSICRTCSVSDADRKCPEQDLHRIAHSQDCSFSGNCRGMQSCLLPGTTRSASLGAVLSLDILEHKSIANNAAHAPVRRTALLSHHDRFSCNPTALANYFAGACPRKSATSLKEISVDSIKSIPLSCAPPPPPPGFNYRQSDTGHQ